MNQKIIEIKEVQQSFRDGFLMKSKTILHGVSFSIPEKTVFGFLGPNGSGKTTLIHLMVGLRKPKGGSILICGKPSHSSEARSQIGYLPERPYFPDFLTGEKFLTYLGTLSGMSPTQLKSRIPQVLKTVDMVHAKDMELKKYSKGMLQRIGIAQAILHEPKVLVFDEPMSGLDPVGRKEVRELMVELARVGHTIFFSTHVIPDAEAICDSVALIEKGRMIGSGPLHGFLSEKTHQVEIAFDGLSPDALSEIEKLGEFRKISEGYRGVVQGEERQAQALAKLVEKKARVLWVTPIRPTLESFFQRGQS